MSDDSEKPIEVEWVEDELRLSNVVKPGTRSHTNHIGGYSGSCIKCLEDDAAAIDGWESHQEKP